MAIDLNNTQEQGSPSSVIPPNSKVLVRLNIIYPTQAGKIGDYRELTCSNNSRLQYLATYLEVVSGSFNGSKFYHNFNVLGGETSGQQKAMDISMRQIRALVESAKGVSPVDASPQAAQARFLNSFTDVENFVFPITVDCEISRPNSQGKQFVNNSLKGVVTKDDPDYAMLMTGGEVITSLAIPKIEDAPKATTTQWGAGAQANTATQAQQTTQAAPPQVNPAPAWTQNRQQASNSQNTAPASVQNQANNTSYTNPASVQTWGNPQQAQTYAPPPQMQATDIPF